MALRYKLVYDETLPSMVSHRNVFSLLNGRPRDCIHFLPQGNLDFSDLRRYLLTVHVQYCCPWSRPSDRVYCHTSKSRLIETFSSRRVECASYANRLICSNVLPGHVRIGMGRHVTVEAHDVAFLCGLVLRMGRIHFEDICWCNYAQSLADLFAHSWNVMVFFA